MLKILISPSKTMDYKSIQPVRDEMEPVSTLTKTFRSTLERMDADALKKLYKASDKVTKEAMEMFSVEDSFKAIELFNGAVFKNIQYIGLDEDAKTYIDNHVMIFSALYGLIPADKGIRPYRLDLNNVLEPSIVQLTEQWKEPVNAYLLEQNADVFIDLASTEYRKLVDRKCISKIIQIDFKDWKDGKLKTIGTYAKMARGQFVNAMATEKIEDLEDVKRISVMGYVFDEKRSTFDYFVYTRS